ncbi:hypothetical protein [Brumimicrobium oceani]|uniref:STAS/SEC14 domain-containing protein n=1 Tax=Brumimicrobium oceani TaxID=2100725 RepID=A0A2U2XG38_9FLAO|nr:hypothetical protein [Brumimicrobium oceani]PWH86768.1 hypothetical protein DIT68_00450 [Brumimicrobium oceani]
MQTKNEYDSPVARITKDENGIFVFKLKNTSTAFDLEEARNQKRYLAVESGGKPYKTIIDTTGSLALPNDEACEYYLTENNFENVISLVVNSLPMQLLLGQLVKRHEVPNIKIFKKAKDAYDWILIQEF